jgi:hypothetical protein
MPRNTYLLIDSDGQTRAAYDKLHLFDLDLPGKVRLMESEFSSQGDQVNLILTQNYSNFFSLFHRSTLQLAVWVLVFAMIYVFPNYPCTIDNAVLKSSPSHHLLHLTPDWPIGK